MNATRANDTSALLRMSLDNRKKRTSLDVFFVLVYFVLMTVDPFFFF
jgi:hypothetical protein